MLHVIGLGVSEQAELSQEAVQALQQSHYIYGSERQLETVTHYLSGQKQQLVSEQVVTPEQAVMPEQRVLPKLSELKGQLEEVLCAGQTICVLASGDPLFYGIGRWLGRFVSERAFSDDSDAANDNAVKQSIRFYPAVSSIQAACHRLGLSLQDVDVVSLHGRPLASLRRKLKQNTTLVILTDQQSYPRGIVSECISAGFTDFTLTVCENLGYPHEKITAIQSKDLTIGEEEIWLENADSSQFSAPQLLSENALLIDANVSPLHVSVLQLNQATSDRAYLPEFPGIPDQYFITDRESGKGMITKREVRLNILSLLQLSADEILWDIGAGCGGVAVESSYWQAKAQVFAIEHHPERLACLEANRQIFGVMSNLNIVAGRAPNTLSELPAPNKVFIGGSDGELAELLQQCWQTLPVGGVLVASAVTENTRQHLVHFYQQRQQARDSRQETLQVAISQGGELAGQLLYRPTLPVVLFKFTKDKKGAEC